jgi:hypothetical protein
MTRTHALRLADVGSTPIRSVGQIEEAVTVLVEVARQLQEAVAGFQQHARTSVAAPIAEEVLTHLDGAWEGAREIASAGVAFLLAFYERYDRDIRAAYAGQPAGGQPEVTRSGAVQANSRLHDGGMTQSTATPDLVAAITENGGFTYDPTAGALVVVGQADGYAIAVPGTEHVVGDATITRDGFAAAVADLLVGYAPEIAQGAMLGGWFSDDRGVYLVELSGIHHVERAEAIRLGTERHQEGILDLATGEYIETGGTGDAE